MNKQEQEATYYLDRLAQVPTTNFLNSPGEGEISSIIVLSIALRRSNHSELLLRFISQITLHIAKTTMWTELVMKALDANQSTSSGKC